MHPNPKLHNCFAHPTLRDRDYGPCSDSPLTGLKLRDEIVWKACSAHLPLVDKSWEQVPPDPIEVPVTPYYLAVTGGA